MHAAALKNIFHLPSNPVGRHSAWVFAPRLLELLLLVAIAWIGMSFIYHPRVANETVKSGARMPEHSQVDIKSLIAAVPFGEMAKQVATVKQPVKVSPLHLQLKGTVLAQGKSAALIEPKKGAKQDVFFVGDHILPGVKLVAVQATYILIDDHGKREKVILEESKDAANTGGPAAGRPSRHGFPRKGRRSIFGGPAANTNNPASGKAHSNFLNMVTLAGLTPHSENGKLQGMSVNQVIPGGLFDKVGLKKGDVIQSMNGKQIMNTQDARKAYKKAKKAGNINIVIVRDGQTQTIYQPVR